MKMIIIFIIKANAQPNEKDNHLHNKKILSLINMIDYFKYFFIVCEIFSFKNIYTYCF